MIGKQRLAQNTAQGDAAYRIAHPHARQAVRFGKGFVDQEIIVFVQQGQRGTRHQLQLAQGTQVTGIHPFPSGKFHIGFVHNDRTFHIGNDLFDHRQWVIVAGRIVGVI